MVKVEQKILKKSVKLLDLDDFIVQALLENGIQEVEDLWNANRTTLKKCGLKDANINQIIIRLQLLGLDLNRKTYK